MGNNAVKNSYQNPPSIPRGGDRYAMQNSGSQDSDKNSHQIIRTPSGISSEKLRSVSKNTSMMSQSVGGMSNYSVRNDASNEDQRSSTMPSVSPEKPAVVKSVKKKKKRSASIASANYCL